MSTVEPLVQQVIILNLVNGKQVMNQRCTQQKGFTYMGVLFAVAIIGVSQALIGSVWKTAQQRENEEQLLFVGSQFRKAIGLYYERTPGVVKRYPNSLEELLEDNRYIVPQRYLRRVYKDPMTNKTDWVIVSAPGGGIRGLHSAANRNPFKQGNFKAANIAFINSKNYADWKFIYQPILPIN